MKTVVIPKIRAEPELRADLDSVLLPGETLTDFCRSIGASRGRIPSCPKRLCRALRRLAGSVRAHRDFYAVERRSIETGGEGRRKGETATHMTFKLEFTAEADVDLDRLFDFLLERAETVEEAVRACEAIAVFARLPTVISRPRPAATARWVNAQHCANSSSHSAPPLSTADLLKGDSSRAIHPLMAQYQRVAFWAF